MGGDDMGAKRWWSCPIIGNCLSVLAMAISVYAVYWQAQVTSRQRRIDIAVDISRNYLHDKDAELNGKKLAWCQSFSRPEGADLEKLYKSSDDLEYVALLANNEQLNASYLSLDLKHNIALTLQLEEKMKSLGSRRDRPEMRKFVLGLEKSERWDCN